MDNEKKERLKALRENMKSYGYTDGVEELDAIFPDIAESEDERVIKTLQEYVKNRNWMLNGPTQDEVLAWLEKHKESNIDKLRRISTPAEENWFEIQKQWEKEDSADEDEKVREELIQYLRDYPHLPNGKYSRLDFFAWIERQKEQKPVQSNIIREYLEERLKGKIDKEGEYYRGAREELAHLFYIFGGQPSQYLINNVAKKEQKPAEWSDDERIRKEIISFLSRLPGDGQLDQEISRIVQEKRVGDWLFYLEKQKEQKPSIFPPGLGEVHWNPIPSVKNGLMQKPVDNVSKDEYVKRFKALCNAYEINLPNREYDIYHLCDDLYKLSVDYGKQKTVELSEDERIRKALDNFFEKKSSKEFEWTEYGIRNLDVLAWIRKQKEPTDKGEISDGYHTFNELYYYRMLYNAAFFNLLPKEWVHKSKKHHDGEDCFGGGWFIVMANLPTGQISNHYKLKDWDLFKIPEKEFADEWDGHTPQQAAERIRQYLSMTDNEMECYKDEIC